MLSSLAKSIVDGLYGTKIQTKNLLDRTELIKLLFLEGIRIGIPFHDTELVQDFSDELKASLQRIQDALQRRSNIASNELKASLQQAQDALHKNPNRVSDELKAGLQRAQDSLQKMANIAFLNLEEKVDAPEEDPMGKLDSSGSFLRSQIAQIKTDMLPPENIVTILEILDEKISDLSDNPLDRGRKALIAIQTSYCRLKNIFHTAPNDETFVAAYKDNLNLWSKKFIESLREISDFDNSIMKEIVQEAKELTRQINWLASITIVIQTGDLNVFQELISQENLSEEDRGMLVVYAANYGRLEIIKELLKEQAVIPDNSRIVAIYCSQEKNHSSVTQELLTGLNIIVPNGRLRREVHTLQDMHVMLFTEMLSDLGRFCNRFLGAED